MMIKQAITGLIVVLVLLGHAWAQTGGEKIWIDVRSPQEFRQGHLEGAVNIPFMQIMRRITEVTTDKQANIHLYCTVGARAEIARQILKSKGFMNVVNAGGLKDIKR